MSAKNATSVYAPVIVGARKGTPAAANFNHLYPFIGNLQRDFTHSAEWNCFYAGTIARRPDGSWYEVQYIGNGRHYPVRIEQPAPDELICDY